MRGRLLTALVVPVILIGAPASAQPLVSVGDVTIVTGDIDVLEDVLEHITILR